MEYPRIDTMNQLTYSFTGSLRAWVNSNAAVFQARNIKVDMPAVTLRSNLHIEFTSDRFEADFYVWEKGHWHKAMSEIEFVDWRIADRDPEYQVESVHYEYATISEMLDTLGILKNRLRSVQSESA